MASHPDGHHEHGHGHGHHHGHGNGHGHAHGTSPADLTERNREHWNKAASTYSSQEWQKTFISKTHAFVRANLDWIGVPFLHSNPDDPTQPSPDPSTNEPFRILDYACGPGTMTAALYPHTKGAEIIGLDLSENMVAEYNANFTNESNDAGKGQEDPDAEAKSRPTETISTNHVTAHAYVGDLLTPSEPLSVLSVSEGADIPLTGAFDLIIVGYAFHHFASPADAAARLAACLKPGGVLMIAELATHEPEPEIVEKEEREGKKGIKSHFGFEEEEIKGFFEGVGLVGFDARRMEGEVVIHGSYGGDGEAKEKGERKGTEMGAFMARAKKPA